jgi:gliding motility-associated-like protein
MATITIDAPGIYVFTAEDDLGCLARTQVTVSVYPELSLSVSTSPVTCPGYSDGVIAVDAIGGGVPPFAIAVDGGTFTPVTNLPWVLNGLAAGNYAIAVMDAASCMFGVTATVDPAAVETLSLGEDRVVLLGDSVDILPFLSFAADTFFWAGDLDGIDPLALNQRLWPESDRVIRLTGVDEHGCVYTDELRIRVLLTSQLDVPNVFSPNEDGINDILSPSFDPSITRVHFFEIYDRWGELVFEARDYVPGTVAGWDGRFRGQPLQPGVFLYRVEAVNKRKQVLQQSGDLTLVR